MAERALNIEQTKKAGPLLQRITSFDWKPIASSLHEWGYATTGTLLSSEECQMVADSYNDAKAFRSHILMARHGFGRGEYKYYANPLPDIIATLRTTLYPPLAKIANQWQQELNHSISFPEDHASFLNVCHRANQKRPTPLLLKYSKGDYNCLHQDLYGEIFFPFQVAFLLSRPGKDFHGGEFVLTEQRPRMQSRVEVVSLQQGEGVIFAVNRRPVAGTRGYYQVTMRHGVSRLHDGSRFTLGIIFHDAK